MKWWMPDNGTAAVGIHNEDGKWVSDAAYRVDADRLVAAHNADIDALTAERDELQRRLDAIVATDHYQRSLDEIHLRYNMEVQRDEFKRRLDDVVALLEPAPDEKLQKMYAEDLHVEYALRELYPRAVAIAEGRER